MWRTFRRGDRAVGPTHGGGAQTAIGSTLSSGEEVVDAINRARALGSYPDDLGPIQVFDAGGQVFSLDNRRLYIAKQAGVTAPVRVRAPETANELARFSTQVAGLFVEVRP